MSCNWCEERLARFVDDELTLRERAGVLAHVDTCYTCRSLFEELRAVDGLLLSASKVDLEPSFTSATMAAIRTMPRPCRFGTPLFAYAVCYLIAAWLLTAAALVLEPTRLQAGFATVASLAQAAYEALLAIGHVAARAGLRGEIGPWPLLVAAAIAVDAALTIALVRVVRKAAQPLRDRNPRW